MKKILCAVLVVVLVVGALAGCGGTPEEQILGQWKDVNTVPAGVYEFKDDGTVTFFVEGFETMPLTGTYEIDGDKVITYFEDGDGKTTAGAIGRIKGNTIGIGEDVFFRKQR